MRVIAGEYGGRFLDTPKGKFVRPTGDKVKGAMFNILNNMIEWEDCKVLDLFCGSGSLGIEALSRGAEDVCFVDKDRTSVKITRQNLESLGEEERDSYCTDALTLRPLGKRYNLLFADPPYDIEPYEKLMKHLYEQKILDDEFVAVLEMDIKTEFKTPDFCELLSEREYGKTKLIFLRSV